MAMMAKFVIVQVLLRVIGAPSALRRAARVLMMIALTVDLATSRLANVLAKKVGKVMHATSHIAAKVQAGNNAPTVGPARVCLLLTQNVLTAMMVSWVKPPANLFAVERMESWVLKTLQIVVNASVWTRAVHLLPVGHHATKTSRKVFVQRLKRTGRTT